MLTTNIELLDKIRDAYQSCSESERACLIRILTEFSQYGYSDTYDNIWMADYKEIPVSIDTFIRHPAYLGKATRNGEAIYPAWWEAYHSIFNNGNKYDEVILTGATRIGKTSTGITGTAYMLYRLMCLRDPQSFFNKKDVSKFSILFFNVTKDLAKGVAFREFNDTLRTSPWFCERGSFSKSEQNFYYIPNDGKITIDYGSDASHGLGKQILVGFMDEINFARAGIKDINKAKQHMQDTYNTISARIKGTFRKNGEVYGKLFAISSKKSDSDFLEDHIAKQLGSGNGDHIYVFDRPQWQVLPENTFKGAKFYIAIGNRHQHGFVVEDTQATPEGLADIEKQGFKLLDVPGEMKSEFLADFDIALRDLAGISVPGALSFITQATITGCINPNRKNPFFTEILEIGTLSTFTIEEFFHMEVVDPKLKRCPLYLHFDLSLNTDKSGISGVCISGRKDCQMPDGKVLSLPAFTHLFTVDIRAPRGDKVPYHKILQFTCWLRSQGFNLDRTSRDQFQSEYLGELLEAKGIPSDKISLDRTPDGYDALKSVLLEQRVDMLNCEILQHELIHLQRDAFSGICDHPIGGSKDAADSFAGAIWNAIQHNGSVTVPTSSVASAIAAINGSNLSSAFNKRNKRPDLPAMFPNLSVQKGKK